MPLWPVGLECRAFRILFLQLERWRGQVPPQRGSGQDEYRVTMRCCHGPSSIILREMSFVHHRPRIDETVRSLQRSALTCEYLSYLFFCQWFDISHLQRRGERKSLTKKSHVLLQIEHLMLCPPMSNEGVPQVRRMRIRRHKVTRGHA